MSNFQPAHLRRLIDETGVLPAVNQIELHPYFQQTGSAASTRTHDRHRGVEPARAGVPAGRPAIAGIAEANAKTPAQVVLRWHIELGKVAFLKSATPERMPENIDIFDFHLTAGEMEQIDALDRGERIGLDPDTHSILGAFSHRSRPLCRRRHLRIMGRGQRPAGVGWRGECTMARRTTVLLWAAVAAVLLGGAPSASAAPALIEGDWGYAGGVVSVARDPGGGFTGTVTRSGSQQRAG